MNALWRRILELFRPAQLDREAVEELSHHIDLLVERNMAAGLEPMQAYLLCSVAIDLRISEIVDVPNFVVTAHCPLAIFD